MPIIASNFKTNHTRKSTSLFVEKLNEYLKSNEAFVYNFSKDHILQKDLINKDLLILKQLECKQNETMNMVQTQHGILNITYAGSGTLHHGAH